MNNKQIKTKEIFFEELCNRFPYNNIEILEYTKASGPITYLCLDCGRTYSKSRANHLYDNKTLCSNCYSGKYSKMRENFLNSLNEHGFQLLDNPNKSLSNKFLIKCNKCLRSYEYKIQENSSFSCRYCGKNGYPINKEEFIKRMIEYDLNEEFEIIEYLNFTSSAVFKHKCGHIFSKLPNNFLNSGNCPKCNSTRSKGEARIKKYLEKNNINHLEQYKIKDLGNLSYDFYLPEHNLLIEFQGEQHYRPIDYYGGEEKFIRQINNDKRKKEYAKNNNITLLEISYLEYDKIEDILKGSTTISTESSSKQSEAETIHNG